jgi:hypothetical protein
MPEITRMYVVLQACPGKTLADIQNFVKNSVSLAKLKKESATIEIQNSTGKTLAQAKFNSLPDSGPTVKYATFLGKVPYDQTILYDNSHGSKPNTLQLSQIDKYNLPVSDLNYTSSTADFVIVIGRDSL